MAEHETGRPLPEEQRVLLERRKRLRPRAWASVLATFVFLGAAQAASARPEGGTAPTVGTASDCTSTGASADAPAGTLLETCTLDPTVPPYEVTMDTWLREDDRYRLVVRGTAASFHEVADAVYCFSSDPAYGTCETPEERNWLGVRRWGWPDVYHLAYLAGRGLPYSPSHVYELELTGKGGYLTFLENSGTTLESGLFTIKIYTADAAGSGDPDCPDDGFCLFHVAFSLDVTGEPNRGSVYRDLAISSLEGSGTVTDLRTGLLGYVGDAAGTVEHEDVYVIARDERLRLRVTGKGEYIPSERASGLYLPVVVIASNTPGCKRGRAGRLILLDAGKKGDRATLTLCGRTHRHVWVDSRKEKVQVQLSIREVALVY